VLVEKVEQEVGGEYAIQALVLHLDIEVHSAILVGPASRISGISAEVAYCGMANSTSSKVGSWKPRPSELVINLTYDAHIPLKGDVSPSSAVKR
jgi:hypothetical protein